MSLARGGVKIRHTIHRREKEVRNINTTRNQGWGKRTEKHKRKGYQLGGSSRRSKWGISNYEIAVKTSIGKKGGVHEMGGKDEGTKEKMWGTATF